MTRKPNPQHPQPARVLADFAGYWQVRRKIVPQSGPRAEFQGAAEWRPAPEGLAYVETGLMTLDGHTPMPAQRRYLWARDLSVFFEDGRFFHKVPALGGPVRHWCDPDAYLLCYDFADWPDFRVDWHVRGPRKSYEATTEYTRR
jgi:hypothetical protein